jgi:hypothetical protein
MSFKQGEVERSIRRRALAGRAGSICAQYALSSCFVPLLRPVTRALGPTRPPTLSVADKAPGARVTRGPREEEEAAATSAPPPRAATLAPTPRLTTSAPPPYAAPMAEAGGGARPCSSSAWRVVLGGEAEGICRCRPVQGRRRRCRPAQVQCAPPPAPRVDL